MLALYLHAHLKLDIAPLKAVWPISGSAALNADSVDDQFGPRLLRGVHNFHTGLAIPKPLGTPVRTVMLGVVTKASRADSQVVVQHDDTLWTGYRHLRPDSIRVAVGQVVDAGDVIGAVGSPASNLFLLRLHLLNRLSNGAVIDLNRARNPLLALPHTTMGGLIVTFGAGATNDSVFITFPVKSMQARKITLYTLFGTSRTVDYDQVVARGAARSDTLQGTMIVKTVSERATSFTVKFAPAAPGFHPQKVEVRNNRGALVLSATRP